MVPPNKHHSTQQNKHTHPTAAAYDSSKAATANVNITCNVGQTALRFVLPGRSSGGQTNSSRSPTKPQMRWCTCVPPVVACLARRPLQLRPLALALVALVQGADQVPRRALCETADAARAHTAVLCNKILLVICREAVHRAWGATGDLQMQPRLVRHPHVSTPDRCRLGTGTDPLHARTWRWEYEVGGGSFADSSQAAIQVSAHCFGDLPRLVLVVVQTAVGLGMRITVEAGNVVIGHAWPVVLEVRRNRFVVRVGVVHVVGATVRRGVHVAAVHFIPAIARAAPA